MASLSFLDRKILVYQCINEPDRMCIAEISGFNMVFRARTPVKAMQAADAWRREAVKNDKLIPKHLRDQVEVPTA